MPPRSLLRHIFRHGPNSKSHKDAPSHEATTVNATHRDEGLDSLPSEEEVVEDIWLEQGQGEQLTALEAPEASRVEQILDLRDGTGEREEEGHESNCSSMAAGKTNADNTGAGDATNTATTTGTDTEHESPHSSRLTHYSSQRSNKANANTNTKPALPHTPKSATTTSNTLPTATATETAKRAIISHIDTLHTTLLFLDALDGFSGTIAEVRVEMEGKVKECEEMLRVLEGLEVGGSRREENRGMFDGFSYMG